MRYKKLHNKSIPKKNLYKKSKSKIVGSNRIILLIAEVVVVSSIMTTSTELVEFENSILLDELIDKNVTIDVKNSNNSE